MERAKRRRDATAMGLSIVAHLVVLTALALHAPKLMRPYEQAGPPEPVIPILIMPRTPPAPPGVREKPRPIRLHRRQLRPDIPPPDIAPFITPPSMPAPAAEAPRTVIQPRFRVRPSPSDRVTTALRNSAIGCANIDLLGPAERERCHERLGRGAVEAPYLGPLGDPALERAAAAREAGRRRREAPVPSGSGGAGGSSGSGAAYRPEGPAPLPPLRP